MYSEIVRHLASGERVRMLVNSAGHKAQASTYLKQAGVDLARVQFLRFPTNRGWTRDFGPIFVRRDGSLAVARFHFNAWAKYKDWKKDDLVAVRAAKQFKLALIDGKIVLEGGSIDVNGRGTLITTEECLLDPKVQARNPGMARLDVENASHDDAVERGLCAAGISDLHAPGDADRAAIQCGFAAIHRRRVLGCGRSRWNP